MNVEDWGGVSFQEGAGAELEPRRQSPHRLVALWSSFEKETKYFTPSEKPFMLNFRVHDLNQVLTALREEGVEVEDKREDSEFGKFGWVMDPEGNRLELWEPPEVKENV